MARQKYIFDTANQLMHLFGIEAADVAWQMMNKLRNKDDVKGASLWLSICAAIAELQQDTRQGTLH